MADVAKILRDLDPIGKLARVARPSGNSAENEREQAGKMIESVAASIAVAVKSLHQPPPPPPRGPPPPPIVAALGAYWRKALNVAALPHDFGATIARFSKSMSKEQIESAIDITVAKVDRGAVDHESAFRYFCGICWRMIRPTDDK